MRAFRAALGEPVAPEPQSVSHVDDLIRGAPVDTTEDELVKKRSAVPVAREGNGSPGVTLTRLARTGGSPDDTASGGLRKRLAVSLRRWAIKRAHRRIERELLEYQDPPELRVAPFFRRRPASDGSPQVFRSLIQVNFYPRQRDEERH